jgi:hypothetical protein
VKDTGPARIATLVARAAPGQLPAVFLVIGTLLLLVGGVAHTDITMRSGVVHAMQCGYRDGNGLRTCTGVDDSVTVVWFSLGSSKPDIYYDDIYYSGSLPAVAVGDPVKVWTVEDQTGSTLAIAIESSSGLEVSDFWHFHDALFRPDTWFAQQLVEWTAEPVGVLLCLLGLLAVNRRIGSSRRAPVTVAVAGAVLTSMLFVVPIQSQLGLDQGSVSSNSWRIAIGMIGAVAALAGAVVTLRRRSPATESETNYAVASLIVGSLGALGLLLAGLALIALAFFFRF